MLTPNDFDLGIIEYFYYNFKIKQHSMFSIFNDYEDDYYNNDKLFLHIFNEIPKTFNEYTNQIQDLKTINKKENHTLIVFEVLELFLKINNCNPNDYHDLFLGLNKLQQNVIKPKKHDKNDEDDDIDSEGEDDEHNEHNSEDDEEQIVYKFKYKLLKKLFSMFEHYFIFYMYVSNKDEYLTKLSTIITSNIHINTQFKLFIKNMNKFLDLFMDEINTDVRNNMFHYISNLKEKYDLLPKPTQ